MAMATTALLSSPTNPAATQRHHPIRGHHIPLLGRGHPREAEAVVAELLLDHSASPADAAAIASRASAYAAMLVDAVRQLDKLGLWASWGAGAGPRAGAGMGALGFGRKA
ncbi:uncharacterized protein [Lolium perenne]|uniref:uncharacterized protein n=1 Tax=Lolium perenne TaxID=4522 RepID=UPI003A99241E